LYVDGHLVTNTEFPYTVLLIFELGGLSLDPPTKPGVCSGGSVKRVP
jgi:hypothetical protein